MKTTILLMIVLAATVLTAGCLDEYRSMVNTPIYLEDSRTMGGDIKVHFSNNVCNARCINFYLEQKDFQIKQKLEENMNKSMTIHYKYGFYDGFSSTAQIVGVDLIK